MANNNLGYRFTEENYSSRSQVARALGTNLIDPFWNSILSYRKEFSKVLPIQDISKFSYNVTFCERVKNDLKEIESQLERYFVSYNKQIDGSYEKSTFLHDSLKDELENVAKANNLFVNDVALNNIIAHGPKDSSYERLVNYLNALENIIAHKVVIINEDSFAELYSLVTGISELSTFYRTEEIKAPGQSVIIDRDYAGAPVSLIEGLMSSMFAFVNNASYSLVLRAAVAFYMINYVKPFLNFNEEMSILVVKEILSSSSVGGIICYAPIASLIGEKAQDIARLMKESQRTRDLTYVVDEVLNSIKNTIQSRLDLLAKLEVKGANESYLIGEDEKKIKEEFGKVKDKPVVEEIKTIEKEKPLIAEVKSIEKPAPTIKVVPKEKVIKVDEPSEKELRKAQDELLETDPMLRPSQAHFYVRHCQKGRYYTIQQFKKAEGCVYETARTSMDNLAKLGYYKREQVKNKFVYTPLIK